LKSAFLALCLISPLLAYATHLLLSEYRDPFSEFHDEYLRSLAIAEASREMLRTESFRTSSADSYSTSGSSTSGSYAQNGSFLRGSFLRGSFLSSTNPDVSARARFKSLNRNLIEQNSFLLKRNKRNNSENLDHQFPSFVELFTILVVAGESPSKALLRISEVANGELADLVRASVAELKSGRSFTEAIDQLAGAAGSATIRRFCDSLIIAIERGTALSEVLHRQVEDVRKRHQIELAKQAGKAEIALMIPVVFLILPISVLFALWPSYLALGQSMG
jgi:hypothetical protein